MDQHNVAAGQVKFDGANKSKMASLARPSSSGARIFIHYGFNTPELAPAWMTEVCWFVECGFAKPLSSGDTVVPLLRPSVFVLSPPRQAYASPQSKFLGACPEDLYFKRIAQPPDDLVA